MLFAFALFLAIDAESLRLPDFDAASVWYLVYFLAALVLGLLFLQWRLRKKHQREALSNHFMQILMRRDLTKQQLKIANNFFDSLTVLQQGEIFLSQKNFAHHLHSYLQTHATISAHDRTEIFDKMFPNSVSQIEIKAVSDLRAGELCAIDTATKSSLGTILKIKEDMLLASSGEPLETTVGAKIQIYAYRPNLGGFLLSGEVLKTDGRSLVFKHSGGIEFKGDQHLMCFASLAFKIERWPHPDIDVDMQPADDKQDLDAFHGLTEKISDRAMVIRFSVAPPEWALKRQDFWEITLDLPEKPLVCRVRILADKIHQTWLARPVDLDQAERNRLYKFIAANNPMREHF
jgi:hypothetical protein